jgi:hypothetical protein
MRKATLLVIVMAWVASLVAAQPKAIFVKAGNAQSFLDAIEQANQLNQDSAHAGRLLIFVPNGTYDLGDRVLTTLTGHNVAIIGESMNGTIIVNKPAVENEGIGKTATLRLMTSDTYLQDLTLKNVLYVCTTKARVPFVNACVCCLIKTPTILTTFGRRPISRTLRFMVPLTLSAGLATSISIVATSSLKNAPQTATGVTSLPLPAQPTRPGVMSSRAAPSTTACLRSTTPAGGTPILAVLG